MNSESKLLYNTDEVSALNKMPQFDPRKFLKKTVSKVTGETTIDVELKYKKLWFRLRYPKGRVFPVALQLNESVAIIECRVFFDKDDEKQASGFIAHTSRETHGPLYVQLAQFLAENEALSSAGFGCQFNDVRPDPFAGLTAPEEFPAAAEAWKEAEPAIVEETTVDEAQEIMEANEPQETEEIEEAEAEETLPVEEQVSDEIADETETVNETAMPEEVSNVHENENDEQKDEIRFTADMTVEVILSQMTMEDAEAIVVDVGICNGWTLAEVLEKRPASLLWYAKGYNGDNNILRAGASLLLNTMTESGGLKAA
jgi:hypothetical protein